MRRSLIRRQPGVDWTASFLRSEDQAAWFYHPHLPSPGRLVGYRAGHYIGADL